jgi:hypothetical protein
MKGFFQVCAVDVVNKKETCVSLMLSVSLN